MLLASSAAKGTIRAGQFGGIANVIQSGGEEGMWTFDRYQRWMEQQRDWVRPSVQAANANANASAAERDVPEIVRAPVRPAAGRGATAAAGMPAAGSVPRVRPRGAKSPGGSGQSDAAGPEEINLDEDVNLEEIQELARQIERRTP
jgi:hypothetical protein